MKTRSILTFATGLCLAAIVCASGQVTFTKITTGPIVTDQGQWVRGAWADFNDDGFLDLIICNYNGGTNVFYQNNRDGTFTKITHGDPVADGDYHVGADVGDFNNDGYPDLIVSSGTGAPTARRNMLYYNNWDGTFSLVSGGGLTNLMSNFCMTALADYDNDGFLDVFITDQGGRNELWHNDGDGTFTRVASGPPTTESFGWNACWCDYDGDGFMDLLVTMQGNSVHNLLYHNNRNGTFTRVLTNAIATDVWARGAEAVTCGDYDNDGLPDLFVTGDNGSPNRLYHNDGNGKFTIITNVPMLTRPVGADSTASAWGDYDDDGYLDLFVSNYNGNNALYHNNGDGTFTQILTGDPVNDGGLAYSLGGWVDINNDGFLDLFITCDNGNVLSLTNRLYLNDGNTNSWLEVKLVGTASNRSAIGAKVRMQATIGGKTFWQMRELTTGGGRWVQPLVAHFGLGDATNADTVRIEWPSGTVQELRNVTAKQILTITEPPRLLASAATGTPAFSLKGGRFMNNDIQASTDLAAWSPVSTVTITNLSGTAQIVDPNAPASSLRFYRAVSR